MANSTGYTVKELSIKTNENQKFRQAILSWKPPGYSKKNADGLASSVSGYKYYLLGLYGGKYYPIAGSKASPQEISGGYTKSVTIDVDDLTYTYVVGSVLPVFKSYDNGHGGTTTLPSNWASEVHITFSDNITVDKPSTPSATLNEVDDNNVYANLQVSISDYKDTSKVKNLPHYARFEIQADNAYVINTSEDIAINAQGYASYTYRIQDTGIKFRVRVRVLTKNPTYTSDWSDYTSESYELVAAPDTVRDLTATATTDATESAVVMLSIPNPPGNITSYTIQYTTDKTYFDNANTGGITEISSSSGGSTIYVNGLETGKIYYFRVKAYNENTGKTAESWSNIASVELGTKPTAPTTWQSQSSIVIGETVTLYWTHNTEDGSNVTKSNLIIQVYDENGTWHGGRLLYITNPDKTTNGIQQYKFTPKNDTEYGMYANYPSAHYIKIVDGLVFKWQVCTKGVGEYSPLSTTRQFSCYENPTVALSIQTGFEWLWDTFNFEEDTVYTASGDFTGELNTRTLEQFPLYICGFSQPFSRAPIEIALTIKALDTYQTLNARGEQTYILQGDEIYSTILGWTEGSSESPFRRFGTGSLGSTATNDSTGFRFVLLPDDVTFENNIRYAISVQVVLNNGLTATSQDYEFTVRFKDIDYILYAEMSYNPDLYVMSISPYCVLEEDINVLPKNVMLAVYRREFDGDFTLINSKLINTDETTIIDPHPSLYQARYRIVGTDSSTGLIFYADQGAYPIKDPSIVIQWDEEWTTYDDLTEGGMASETPWSGSLVRLPYNIDINTNSNPDAEAVEYIGRQHPVGYYGTQVGQTYSYSTDVDASDDETLYQLRRLQVYMGDVYLRDPSGNGYWAQIKVSFSSTHKEVIIPVTIEATRVEGGV